MDRSYLDRLITANSERVLLALTHQQHLHPARSAAEMVQAVCKEQGFTPAIGEHALEQTAVPSQMRAGRLSRQILRDLAQSMESVWQVALSRHLQVAQAH
jgi:hypothetical protein